METKPKVHDLGKAIQRMKADKEAINKHLDEHGTLKNFTGVKIIQPPKLPTEQ
ncbi:hypothetical protein [Fibrella aquatilis]|uniref:Uncharacterized protein n=1 Tax=Fibrella aquatilis TaxID=2817059 RepID=A0A939K0M5_9BACT|nr:hypothetical protein [Fibrella aquatilis]MBO0931375.1 hypothetical protein [Fibrella aquatilis]